MEFCDIFNHFLAKSRDIEDRVGKDFNAVADVLAEILTKERDSPNQNSNIDFLDFRCVLNKRGLSSFDKCIKEYEKAKNDAPLFYSKDCGELVVVGCFYQDNTPIIAVIDKLLKFTKRK